MSEIKNIIAEGKSILGIEFGSTRIKAVLIEPDTFKPIAQGAHEWENRLEDGLWTYHLDDIWSGLQDCYQDLQKDVQNQYGVQIIHELNEIILCKYSVNYTYISGLKLTLWSRLKFGP